MTLITYPTRVHFADSVLEEALHSELESAGTKAPLLIFDQSLQDNDFEDRMRAGLPAHIIPQTVIFDSASDLRQLAKEAAELTQMPDALIAFGTARAIELSRKCRYAIAQKHRNRLPLFAVPGVDGLPGPCMRRLESYRRGLPTVLICDPTLMMRADPADSQAAVLFGFVRCVEAYLSDAYNPVAEGLALDGLHRCMATLPLIFTQPGRRVQRELMAINLNAAMCQEKGIGPALMMSDSLSRDIGTVGQATFARLLLPAVIRESRIDTIKSSTLLKIFGDPKLPLDQAVARILAMTKAKLCLADFGVTDDMADRAAETTLANLGFAQGLAVLASVWNRETRQ